MSNELYDAVKSGRVKLEDLNDDGIKELKSYMDSLSGQSTPAPVQPSLTKTIDQTSSIATPKVDKRNKVEKVLDYVFKDNPIAKVVTYPFTKMAEYATPDTPYFGSTDPNDTPRANLIRQNVADGSETTGNKTLDKIGDYVGQVGSMFTPMGTGGTGTLITDIEKGVAPLLGTKVGAALESASGKLATKGVNVVNPLLNKAGINISTDLAQKAGQSLVKGAALGAGYGAAQPIALGNGDLSEIPKSVAENALMFGGGDAAIPFAGAGLSAIGKKVAGTKLGDAFSNFLSKNKADAPIDTPITPKIQNTPVKLKILNNEDSFVSAMDKVIPQATERMTPPLENENELAKWVQSHLNQDGHDISLNEVRKLDYNDLSDMANEIKKGFNTYNVVRQTAHDMGYGKIFDQTAPSIKDQIASNAQKRVYGIYPDKVNVTRSTDSLNVSKKPFITQPKISNVSDLKIGDSAIPTSADGADLSGAVKISDIQSKDGIKYYQFEGSKTYMPENMVRTSDETINSAQPNVSKLQRTANPALNADVKEPQPIKLSDKEIAKNAKIEKFSQTSDNLGELPNTADQIQSSTTREPFNLARTTNEAYIKGVDNVQRINQFTKDVEKVQGELDAEDNPYMKALNSRGHNIISRQILERNLVDSKGKVVGESLLKATKKIPKDREKAFDDYLVLKHAISRMGRGEKVYEDGMEMTVQKAEAKIAEYNKSDPTFHGISKEIHTFLKKFAKVWGVDTGLITQSAYDGFTEASPDYIPNNRIFSNLEKSKRFGSAGSKFADQTQPFQRAEGSQRKIVSPIESIINNVAKTVKIAKQNEVMQAVYKIIEKNPDEFSDYIEKSGESKETQDSLKSKLKDAKSEQKLHEDDEDTSEIDNIVGQLSDEFNKARTKEDASKNNIISFMRNGEKLHMKVHDFQFLESLTNLSPQSVEFVMKTVGKVTNVMKLLTTGINPVFSLTRNVVKDIPMAILASKSSDNPLRIGIDMVDSVLSAMADTVGHSKLGESKYTPPFLKSWLETRGKLYNDFKNVGGGHSSAVAADRNLLAQSKENLLSSKTIGQKIKLPFRKAFHSLENLSGFVESAPRLGEFKRFSKDGSYSGKVKGLYEANDITTNFSRYGNYTKAADSVIPYLNASIQGLDKFGRIFKDNPVKATVKAAGLITLPTVLLFVLNHNNPDYQELSNYTKDNNYLIPNGDGTFTKFPKPREAGMIFSSLIERTLREWSDHDPKGFQDFKTNLIQNMAPPLVSGVVQHGVEGLLDDTIAAPIQSLKSNKDFVERPIVPQDLQDLSPSLQYDARTSEPAKFLGKILGYSPKKIDYLTKSYGGLIGQILIPATTKGATVGSTLKQQITADPIYSNDISRNFYNAKNKADTAVKDSQVTGKFKEKDLNMSEYYGQIASNFTLVRKQMKLTQDDKSLSGDEKKAKLRELQILLNDMQKKGLAIN